MTLDKKDYTLEDDRLPRSKLVKKSLSEAYTNKLALYIWKIDFQTVGSKVYNHKFDFYVDVQKAITSYLWSIYNEYWIWFKSPYVDFDKQGNFITQWWWSHSFPDSKDPSEYNNLFKLRQLINRHPEAQSVIRNSITFWKALKSHLKSVHIENSTRHEKTVTESISFAIDTTDKFESRRYNSILKDFYWLLWPYRNEVFEEMESKSSSEEIIQLSLTSEWKKLLTYVFQILFNEYSSDDSRSPWIDTVFTENQKKRVKWVLIKWDNLSYQDIIQVLDILLMKDYSTNEFLKKITKTYSNFKSKRAGSKNKVLSYINTTSVWRNILRYIDRLIMKEKKERTSDRKDYWTFMDSFVTLLVVLHKYKLDEVEKIFSEQNNFCNELIENLESEFPWLRCEANAKIKDIYSCVQKLLTSPWRITLSDIIWFQVEYSTEECENMNDSSEIQIFFYKKIFEFYKSKWFEIHEDLFLVSSESELVIKWLSENIDQNNIQQKLTTTKLSKSSDGYIPYKKIQWSIIDWKWLVIPFENRIREAWVIENNMASYSYYKIRNTLDMYARERIYFNLKEYSEKIEEFIYNHYEYCMKKKNYYQEKYKISWDAFDLSRVKKYSKEAIIDTKNWSYDLLDQNLDIINLEWINKKVLKDIVCTFMEAELEQWNYMEFIYELDIWSSIYSDLYKSSNTIIPSITIEQCYSWNNLVDNIKFTWRNIKYNIETSLFPTHTRIWERNSTTNQTTFLTNKDRISLIKTNNFFDTSDVDSCNTGYLWIRPTSYSDIYQLETASFC